MGLVIDTSAYSEFQRGNQQITQLLIRADRIFIPVIVLGELYYGYINGNRVQHNMQRLSSFLNNQRVTEYAVQSATAEHYATVRRGQRLNGKTLADNDLWIAAICRQLQQPLLTLDSDFSRIEGLELARL